MCVSEHAIGRLNEEDGMLVKDNSSCHVVRRDLLMTLVCGDLRIDSVPEYRRVFIQFYFRGQMWVLST